MAGLEVEELEPVAPPFTKIVVGEIKAAEQHPNADRLRVCQVDVGGPELLTIVCGAPNARVGIRVPCATVGAELPPGEDGKPFLIKIGKLRGVESFGMLCSARELKLSEDHGGLMELPLDAPLGQNIREYLNLDDTLFTLKLTPNLAHCLSVYGVAREVAALTGAPLKPQSFTPAAVGVQDKPGREDRGARPVRPLLGPRGAQCQHPGEDAAVDGRSPGALRPAQRGAAGGHLQLRDVRAGSPFAHLRPGQDPRRPAGALGQGRRAAQAAQRQHRHRGWPGGRDRR